MDRDVCDGGPREHICAPRATPPGFAHRFCVTSESALFAYECTEIYRPEHELGIARNDPDIGITWPVEEPALSGKDRLYPRLADVPESRLPP